MDDLTHENGLTLSIASDLKHEKIKDGFIVRPQGGRGRGNEVAVTFTAQKPEGNWLLGFASPAQPAYYGLFWQDALARERIVRPQAACRCASFLSGILRGSQSVSLCGCL